MTSSQRSAVKAARRISKRVCRCDRKSYFAFNGMYELRSKTESVSGGMDIAEGGGGWGFEVLKFWGF